MANILITSAGRRGYLVQWFREAAQLTGVSATIYAGDANRDAPALKHADVALQLPPITAKDYVPSIIDICQKHEVDILFALHDYDIAILSEHALEQLQRNGTTPMIPPFETITTVTDKKTMGEVLAKFGIPTPRTVAGSEASRPPHDKSSVVKHRFGSGSSGVLIVPNSYLSEAITISSISAPDQTGAVPVAPDPNLVIVQEKIEGQEFGLDIVCDQYGVLQGVLARKKLGMRAGETDRAETVDATPFRTLAEQVANAIALRGNTDIDVMVTESGEMYVIDINPRFGGGYPFCHVAGANVPACYLAWVSGQAIQETWLKPRPGVIGSKQATIEILKDVSGETING